MTQYAQTTPSGRSAINSIRKSCFTTLGTSNKTTQSPKN
nr:MAG TPA: hypothetical protein [Herelleviridae sp.]